MMILSPQMLARKMGVLLDQTWGYHVCFTALLYEIAHGVNKHAHIWQFLPRRGDGFSRSTQSTGSVSYRSPKLKFPLPILINVMLVWQVQHTCVNTYKTREIAKVLYRQIDTTTVYQLLFGAYSRNVHLLLRMEKVQRQ